MATKQKKTTEIFIIKLFKKQKEGSYSFSEVFFLHIEKKTGFFKKKSYIKEWCGGVHENCYGGEVNVYLSQQDHYDKKPDDILHLTCKRCGSERTIRLYENQKILIIKTAIDGERREIESGIYVIS